MSSPIEKTIIVISPISLIYLLFKQAEVVVYDPKVKIFQIYVDLEYLRTHSSDELIAVMNSWQG